MNKIIQGIFGLFLAAILAFWFNKRLEVGMLRQRLQADTYSYFVEAINNLNNSIISLVALIGSIPNKCVLMRYIDRSAGNDKNRKNGYIISGEVYKQWQDYDKDLSDNHLDVLNKLGKVHRLVETSFFMYPRLEKSFGLLTSEHDPLEKRWQHFQNFLNNLNLETHHPICNNW